MKICATNISYKNLNFKDFLDKITLTGYQNIEVAPFLIYNNPFESKNKIKKTINSNNIIIESFQSIFHNIENSMDDIKVYETTLERFEKIANLSKNLSVNKISIGNCPSRRLDLEKNKLIDFNLKIFDLLSSISNKYEIEISIEPVKRKYFNNFLFSTKEVIFFIRKLKKKYKTFTRYR